MKATNTLLSTIIIGVTLIIMTGCSQGEDLIDAGTQALNAATNKDKELSYRLRANRPFRKTERFIRYLGKRSEKELRELR